MKNTPSQVDFKRRFWSKVRKTDSCWLWLGWKDKDGYGMFDIRVDGAPVKRRASHTAWFYATGAWPKKLLRHTCDTPACVRFTHLRKGTQAQNIADKMRRGRQAKGSKAGAAILTEQKIRIIRALYRMGWVQTALARKFGTVQVNISDIVCRKSWRHVK